MQKYRFTVIMGVIAAFGLSGCLATKTAGFVAGTTAKTAYKTGEFATKGVIGTGKLAGAGLIGAGKSVYYIGKIPVDITDRALKTTSGILTVTTQTVDLTGKVVSVSRDIQAYKLEGELSKIRGVRNILRVSVDAAT